MKIRIDLQVLHRRSALTNPVAWLKVRRVLKRVLLELLAVNALYHLWLILTIVTKIVLHILILVLFL